MPVKLQKDREWLLHDDDDDNDDNMYLIYNLQTSSLQNINKKLASLFILMVKKYWNCGTEQSFFLIHQSVRAIHIRRLYSAAVFSDLAGSRGIHPDSDNSNH